MIFRTAVFVTRMYSGVRGAPHRLQAVRPSTRLTVALLHRVQSRDLFILSKGEFKQAFFKDIIICT